MTKRNYLYTVTPEMQTKAKLTKLLAAHPEVKFVSFMGVDFAGNDTDEKIPIKVFIEDMDTFLNKYAAQTDGSSVVLPGIATLNDARVDMIADKEVNWYVDYNFENFDEETGLMIGTLRVPSFLVHNEVFVDSRSILKNSLAYVKDEMLKLIKSSKSIPGLEHIKLKDIEDLIFTSATELEFWVKSPSESVQLDALSSSQVMQEQYWQRSRGNVRTALEQSIEMLELYGLEPEMGHKECGGIKAQIDGEGHTTHVMEQLEIDWKYSTGVQTADNELLARILVKEVFRKHGLEVTFQAKPIPGVAGNGEHVHVGIAAKLKNGKVVNLMAPSDMKADFLSAIGYGSIMGLLKNYEVINPFISATNDSLNRLKPGFEAPVCIVTSLGHTPDVPSRNRTILAGLVRDIDNPMATRIEMRSPNPFTNTYLAIAVFYVTMLDGIKACVNSGKSLKELEQELSKKYGKKGFYLEKNREYRTEEDVFDDFSAEERSKLFGTPPATVWENMHGFDLYPDKVKVLTSTKVIRPEFVQSFAKGALIRWRTEILNKLIPTKRELIGLMIQLHDEGESTWDDEMWAKISALRNDLARDSEKGLSIFTRLKKALNDGDFAIASKLQLEMVEKMAELKALYRDYSENIID